MTSLAVEDGFKIAVLLPCYNEALTVGTVVRGFADALPGATVYVFDNNSTDDTARAAVGRRRARLPRGAPGQGQRGPPHVRRHRRRHLRHGGRRRHLRPGRRAVAGQCADHRARRHGGRHAPRRRARRRPLRPRFRQSQLQPALPAAVRRRLHRHFFGLPRLHPSFREELSGALDRLRDRDGDERACRPADDPGRRDRPELRTAAERLGRASCGPSTTASAS